MGAYFCAMKLSAVFIALLFSTFCVLSADKNELKVKINHDNKQDTGSIRKSTIQFKYDTTGRLQITNSTESGDGIFLRRGEVEKMLKFADAVYENKITGVKKGFKDKTLWTSLVDYAPVIDVDEDVKTVTKYNIEIYWQFWEEYERWNYRELLELNKIFDETQKEVFKKYDILKALND